MSAPRPPPVRLFDDALPAPLFRRLLKRIVGLGSERLRTSYQTTFWFPLTAQPANVVEDAVLALRPNLPARPPRKLVGVEWWLSRMRTSNVQVDFHRDLDNARLARDGVEVNPVFSSVLYLNRCRGGLLAVTAQPPNADNPALAPDRHDFDFVEPRGNRFCFFPAKLTHGVLDANNEIPLRKLPREPGLRLAIAINWWHQRPLGVPTFAETKYYRSLAD